MTHAPSVKAALDAAIACAKQHRAGKDRTVAHRPCMIWSLLPDSAAFMWGDHAAKPTSAHALLAAERDAAEVGRTLLHAFSWLGALDVALREARVEVVYGTGISTFLVKPILSGVLLSEADKGIGTGNAESRLTHATDLLGRVPCDPTAPRLAYQVDRVHVAAPTPLVAAALHLVRHNPQRLDRLLTSGASHGPSRLEIVETITRDGEKLFAGIGT